MSENTPKNSAASSLKASAPTCTCELVVENDTWTLKPDPSPACVNAVDDLKTIGPNAKTYVAKHITPQDPEVDKALKRLKDSEESSG